MLLCEQNEIEYQICIEISSEMIFLKLFDDYLEQKGKRLYIRDIENSDWVRTNSLKEEDLKYSIFMFFAYFATAITEVANAVERQALEDEYNHAENSYQRGIIEEKIRRAERRADRDRQVMQKMRQDLRKHHRHEITSINRNYRDFISNSIINNFSMLNFSDEVKRLDAYWILIRKKEEFDNYVRKKSYKAQPAEKQMDIRKSLDD